MSKKRKIGKQNESFNNKDNNTPKIFKVKFEI